MELSLVSNFSYFLEHPWYLDVLFKLVIITGDRFELTWLFKRPLTISIIIISCHPFELKLLFKVAPTLIIIITCHPLSWHGFSKELGRIEVAVGTILLERQEPVSPFVKSDAITALWSQAKVAEICSFSISLWYNEGKGNEYSFIKYTQFF